MLLQPSALPMLRRLPELLLVLPILAALRQRHVFPASTDPAASVVSGPDAGAWAMSAIAVANGELDQVDPHRLPTFLCLTALASTMTDGIPQAGHLVGVAAWFAMVAATTLLGRAAGGPLVGAIAGMLITTPDTLLHAATRFSVDPVIAAILPMSLVAVVPARRWFWMALPAGIATGVAMGTHFTALPYGVPAFLLLLLRGGPGGESIRLKLARPLMFIVGATLVIAISGELFVSVGPDGLVRAISEGISSQRAVGPQNQDVMAGTTVELSRDAQAVLYANSATAWNRGATDALKPWFWPEVPWSLLLAALWLGVVGIVCSRPIERPEPTAAPQPRSGRARRPKLDLTHGFVLLICLAPVPILAAANAPERYAANLLPFVAVLLARGVAGPVALLDWVGGWPARALGTIALLVACSGPIQRAQDRAAQGIPPLAGNVEEIVQLTNGIQRAFPGDGPIVTPMIESAAMLSRPHCPRQSCWGSDVSVCLNHMRKTCPGNGPIPLVWLVQGPTGMGDDTLSQAVGAHAAQSYGTVSTVRTASMHAVLVSIPRTPEP